MGNNLRPKNLLPVDQKWKKAIKNIDSELYFDDTF
jgi:hypothetical protein